MYSFSFQEFLWALDKRTLADMVVQATPEDPLPELIHAKALEYLRVFLVIGGMPECVARYVETGSMLKCQQILSELMISYQDDFKKYHEKIPVNVLRDVLRSVALQGQGKFVYTQVGSDYRTPVVKEALDMLCMAGLIYTVVHTDSNGVPLYAEAKEKYKRYIFMDTGLLQRTLELDLTDILVSDDIKLVNRGALAEVFVGDELVKSRPPYLNDILYCWHREKKNSNAEVDYVVSRKGRIYPIEVKAGVRGTMQSMRIFMDAKQLDKGIRTSLENFGEFDDTHYAVGEALMDGVVLEKVVLVQGTAMGEVAKEQMLHAERHLGVVDEKIGLAIVLKTTEIDIGGATRADHIVDDEQLGMVDAWLVEVELDSGIVGTVYIGAGGVLDKPAVGMLGQHHADIDAGESLGGERHKHGLGRNEIRRLDVDILARLVDEADIALHQSVPGKKRAAQHDLCQAVVGLDSGGWIVLVVAQNGMVYEIPVIDKGALE